MTDAIRTSRVGTTRTHKAALEVRGLDNANLSVQVVVNSASDSRSGTSRITKVRDSEEWRYDSGDCLVVTVGRDRWGTIYWSVVYAFRRILRLRIKKKMLQLHFEI